MLPLENGQDILAETVREIKEMKAKKNDPDSYTQEFWLIKEGWVASEKDLFGEDWHLEDWAHFEGAYPLETAEEWVCEHADPTEIRTDDEWVVYCRFPDGTICKIEGTFEWNLGIGTSDWEKIEALNV